MADRREGDVFKPGDVGTPMLGVGPDGAFRTMPSEPLTAEFKDLADAFAIAMQPLLMELKAIRIGIQMMLDNDQTNDDIYALANEFDPDGSELNEGNT